MEISAKEGEKGGRFEVAKLKDLELNRSSAALNDFISGKLHPPAGQRRQNTHVPVSQRRHASELG